MSVRINRIMQPLPEVSVIVPARNEEACIGSCLASLAAQSGVDFEILVIDDNSTDKTADIARSFRGVSVISAGPLPVGWTGKSHALTMGLPFARGTLLLFTDADTVHLAGSLADSVRTLREKRLSLLSYSPQQDAYGLAEKLVQPIIFAELDRVYSFAAINDMQCPLAAANGQYILVDRKTYEEVGGHGAVRTAILEDVELAKLFKRANKGIWFGSGAGRVRARMYSGFADMWEGWSKNLALLFKRPLLLAVSRFAEFCTVLVTAVVVVTPHQHFFVRALSVVVLLGTILAFWKRIHNTTFSRLDKIVSLLGLPIFVGLLVNSYLQLRIFKRVSWKDRTYATPED